MFFDKKLYTSPQVQNGNSNPRKALLKIYIDECTWLKKSCPNSTVSNPQIRTVFSKISPSGGLKSAILDKEIVIFGPSNPQNSDKPLGKLPGALSDKQSAHHVIPFRCYNCVHLGPSRLCLFQFMLEVHWHSSSHRHTQI